MTTDAVRVLLLSPSGKPGGAERALAGLARHLPRHDIEPVSVMLESGELEAWLHDAGCSPVVIHAGRLRDPVATARTVYALRRVIATHEIHAVVSNMDKGHVYGALAAWASGLPSIWWQQGIPTRSRFSTAAAALPCAAVVSSCDEAVRAQRALTPRHYVTKVPLGSPVAEVASRRGTGAGVRRRRGWNGPVVGLVGRLEPWKGHRVFLRAAALLAPDFRNVRFAVVGGAILGWEGDYAESLNRLACSLGIGDRVDFVGHQDDVYPWFDALDVVVNASRAEPFGLVVVEAMALGKPVVATNRGGPAEIIEPGKSGLLVEPGNPEALAEALAALLSDEHLRARIGAEAERRAAEFTEEKMAARFARLLHATVEARRGGVAKQMAEAAGARTR